jgi:uncharacterized membrane protein
MSEYQRTMVIEAQADDVFDFVSDIKNLPSYLPTVRSATLQSGDRIRVQGEAGGKRYDDDGYFRIDKEARRLEWGSDGENQYSGWMQVEEGVEEVFTSRVSVHLSYEPSPEMVRQFERQGGTRDDVINEGIDNALRSIKNLCEEKGDKVESQSAT